MDKYFITEEWNESDQLPHGRRTSLVTAYGKMPLKRIKAITDGMERYSPYDYVDDMVCDDENAYKRQLIILEENGSTIEFAIKKQDL
jgi:hypothetical protein